MAEVKLDQKVFLGGYELSTRHTQVAESAEIEELDATTFGSDTKIAEPGLKGYGLSGEGLWAGGDHEIDDVLFDQQRVRDLPVTIAVLDGEVGSPVRSVLAMIGSYEFSGGHGELMTVSYELGAMDAPVHGRILHNAEATGAVTGEPVELGAVGTGQKVHGVLHVFAGDSALTVKIQSADRRGVHHAREPDRLRRRRHRHLACLPVGHARRRARFAHLVAGHVHQPQSPPFRGDRSHPMRKN